LPAQEKCYLWKYYDWHIENAFQELDRSLASEIETLAYPAAALLSFCLALLTYNLISVVKSSLDAEHKGKVERSTLSGHYLAGEIAAACHGLTIAVSAGHWRRHFASLRPAAMAAILKTLAAHAQPDRIRGPRKPYPKRLSGKRYSRPSESSTCVERRS
jgi:hypothetical protein